MKLKPTRDALRAAARYLKIVEWSEGDGCFVGRAPGLFFGGCHGADERKVYAELCGLVETHVAELLASREPLPPATAGKRYSGKFVVRIGPELHRKVALKALAQGTSLNHIVASALAGDTAACGDYLQSDDSARLRLAEEAYAADAARRPGREKRKRTEPGL